MSYTLSPLSTLFAGNTKNISMSIAVFTSGIGRSTKTHSDFMSFTLSSTFVDDLVFILNVPVGMVNTTH